MTHGGMFSFVPIEILVLFVMGVLILGPASFVVLTLYEHGYRIAGTLYGAVAVVLYPPASYLFIRHGQLQNEAARQADCMGYTEAGLPDRCVEVLMTAPQPDGFFLVIGSALALSSISLVSMLVYGYADEIRDIPNRWNAAK